MTDMKKLYTTTMKGWYEETWLEYREATQEEVLAAALSLIKSFPITSANALEGTVRPWCAAHDAPYEDFGAIDKGCGWGNPGKSCESGDVRIVIGL